MICQECHCRPSCRYDCDGRPCFCKCHDVADAAPELLAACKMVLDDPGLTPSANDVIRAAIAEATKG